MNCIVKVRKTWAQRAETRNNAHYCLGIGLASIGVVYAILGAVYIVACIVNPVAVSPITDTWVRALVRIRYDITWIGLALFCLGTLFKWRAEKSQAALERTTRFVDYDELKQLRAARR